MSDTPKKEYKFRKPHYNVYKPLKKENGGAALQFSYDSQKRAIFLEAASQKGVKLPIGDKDQFDWDNKIVFKIGVADIGKLLLLFSGREKEVECLHSQQETKRTSVLKVTAGTYNDKPNFKVQLSRTAEGQTSRVGLFMNSDELAVLAHFVREALTRMLGY